MGKHEDLVVNAVIKNPHLLGQALGKTLLRPYHSNWIRTVWDQDRKINPFQAARGTYKTTAITEVGIVRQLFLTPNARIAIIRPSHSEAVAVIKNIRQFMATDVMQDLFYSSYGISPRETIKKESSVTWNFKKSITKEGSLDAYGIGSNITGQHYDYIVLCDIITIKDRVSQANREKTIEFMMEVINNVLDPDAKLIHEGTPWHKKDGWFLTPPEEKDKWDVYRCKIRTEKQIEELKGRLTDVLFACNHLLTHIASSDLIFLNPITAMHTELWKNTFAHVDAKYAGNHCGAWCIMKQKTNGKIQAMGELFYEDFSKAVEVGDAPTGISKPAKDIVRECAKRFVKIIWIEENADRGFGVKELERAVDYLYKRGDISHKPMVKGYHEAMNKDAKIQTYGKRYWDSIEWVTSTVTNSTQDDFIEQVMDYMDGQEPNDAPDSMASLLRQWFHPEEGGTKYGYLYEL